MKLEEYSSLQAEQSVLGIVILESNVFEDIQLLISSKDFYYSQNKIIYENMLQLYKEVKKIDLLLLIEKLRNTGLLESVGGISYITRLSTMVCVTSMYKQYCKVIKDMAIKRKIKIELESLLDNLKEKDVSDIVENLERTTEVANNVKSFSSLYTSFGNVNTRNEIEKLSTGFLRVDRALNGLEVGALTIITGEPSTGKTTILNQIIAHNMAKGEKVLMYSGELPQRKIKGWFTVTAANEKHIYEYVDDFGVKRYGVNKQGAELIEKWANDKLYVFNDDSKPSLKNLTGAITSLHRETGARLVVLDNLMTMVTDNVSSDKYQRQIDIASTMKNLAKKLQIVIILVAHANKESAKNKEPHMFDISGASEVPGLADYILKTMRTIVKDKETGEVIGDQTALYISKNRNEGVQGMGIKTYYNKKRRRFETEDRTELNANYGYDESDKFQQVDVDDLPF